MPSPPDPLTQLDDLGDAERWVVLWGYVGEVMVVPGQDGGEDRTNRRIYLDLTKEHWLEINDDLIAHRQNLEVGRGSLLWVPRDAWVVKVDMARAADFHAASGFLSGGFWRQAQWSDEDERGGGPPRTTIPYRC